MEVGVVLGIEVALEGDGASAHPQRSYHLGPGYGFTTE